MPQSVGISGEVVVVRVLSSPGASIIEVYADNSDLLLEFSEGGRPPQRLDRGATLVIRVDGATLSVETPTFKITAGQIRVTSPTHAALSVRAPGKDRRRYDGEMEIRRDGRSGKLMILNRVDIESYVSSVVSSEYGLHDEEGAKAMAVVARTYALRSRGDDSATGSYLLDDSRAQVYRGAQSITAQSRRAALETRGETLQFDGALIQAVYSSSNGGKTAPNESIWAGEAIPYLRGKNDPYDSISPFSNWNVALDESELHAALSKRYNMSVRALKFRKPASDGRVRNVDLIGDDGINKSISGAAFRAVASTTGAQLKSTYFRIKKKGSRYEIKGRGYGHGVGLSQWGAHGMALKGSGYKKILNFYYPGTTLSQSSGSGYLAQNHLANDRDNGAPRVDAGGSNRIERRTILGWGGNWADLPTTVIESVDSSDRAKRHHRRAGW